MRGGSRILFGFPCCIAGSVWQVVAIVEAQILVELELFPRLQDIADGADRIDFSASLAASFSVAQSLDALVVLYPPALSCACRSLDDGICLHSFLS